MWLATVPVIAVTLLAVLPDDASCQDWSVLYAARPSDVKATRTKPIKSDIDQQRQLAMQLLKHFNIHHDLAAQSDMASRRPATSEKHDIFVPSNPYWLFTKNTRKKPTVVETDDVLFDMVTEETRSQKNHRRSDTRTSATFQIKTSVKAKDKFLHPGPTTHPTLIHVSTPQTPVKRKSGNTSSSSNATFSTPPMLKFTADDVPKRTSSWRPLTKEEVIRKITKTNSKRQSSQAGVSLLGQQESITVSPTGHWSHHRAQAPIQLNRVSAETGQESTHTHTMMPTFFSGMSHPMPFSGPAPHNVLPTTTDKLEPIPEPEPSSRYKQVFNIGGKPVYTVASHQLTANSPPTTLIPGGSFGPTHEQMSRYQTLRRDTADLQRTRGSNLTRIGSPSKLTVKSLPPTPPAIQTQSEKHYVRQPTHHSTNFQSLYDFADAALPTSKNEIVIPIFAVTPRSAMIDDDTTSLDEGFTVGPWEPLNTKTAKSPFIWSAPAKSIAKRDTSSSKVIAWNSSNPLDDSETIKPNAMWRGIPRSKYQDQPNKTAAKQDIAEVPTTQRRVGFTAESISPFDNRPIGKGHRVATVYGRETRQMPVEPMELHKAAPSELIGKRHDNLFKEKYGTDYPSRHDRGTAFGNDRDDLFPKRDSFHSDSETRFPFDGPGRPLDKFDPEFGRQKYLKPPPLFPERFKDHDKFPLGPEQPFDKEHIEDRRFPPPLHDFRHDRRPNSIRDKLEEGDPSRFDDLEAWKYLSRPPLPVPGFPPFRHPGFGGPFPGEVGIGTIIPVKKQKLNSLLFGKGGFQGSGIFGGGHQQGWYCPCSYYPPANRFVTSGFPGFWGGPPEIGR